VAVVVGTVDVVIKVCIALVIMLDLSALVVIIIVTPGVVLVPGGAVVI